ncbi:MAG: GvpL/GvpF family gas vesicle protein [Ignavibacteria bacterium]|jgi:hypothetical protein
MHNTKLYIYGVVNQGKVSFTSNGDVSIHEKIFSINYKNISAIVSNSKVHDYFHSNKKKLAEQLLKHQTVIEELMNNGYTVIPMKLGTQADEENEVIEILKKGYEIITDVFEKINDKIEIDLAATWSDMNSVLREIGEENDIIELKNKLLSNSEKVTFEDKIKVGQMVQKGLERKREEYSAEIKHYLSEYCENLKIHELMDDKMVINTALLLKKTNYQIFEKKLENLNAKYSDKLNFRCIGPLPTYSFFTLEVDKILPEDLKWARDKLGISDKILNQAEIRKAYQKTASLYHPDKNPGITEIKNEFNDITKAYKLLTDYCEFHNESALEEDYSINSGVLESPSTLVKVRL